MSQGSRPSYLDYAEDNDDVLNKSWDVESRHRLQENALKLQGANSSSSAGAEAEVFRARVELGLHELTAALSSLSRRIDKLEETTAPPEKEKQDKAVKELARSARCLSQALPGIASSRTRRRALHGYFREADEQHGNCGDRIDPATRALVVEGLSCLAGKVRVDTVWSNKIDGRGLGLGSSGLGRSSASRGLSQSPPRRRRSPTRSTKYTKSTKMAGRRVDEEGDKEEEDEEEEKKNVFGGAAAKGAVHLHDGGGGGGGGKAREFALPLPRGLGFASPEGVGGFESERLEVEHLGNLGAPSPITLTGSVDGRMFAPAPVPKMTERSRFAARKEERGEVDVAAEYAGLQRLTSGQSKKHPQQGASERKSDSSATPQEQESSSGALKAKAVPPAKVAPPTRVCSDTAADGADGAGFSKEGGRTATERRPRSTGDGGMVEASGAGVKSSRSAPEHPGGTRRNHESEDAANTDGCVGVRAPSEQELMARVLLNAAGVAAEAEERAGGPWACGEGHSLAQGKVVAGGVGGDGGARDAGATNSCQVEIEAVRALNQVRRPASHASLSSSSSSSPSSSCGSASVTAAVAAATVRSAVAGGVPGVSDGTRDKAAAAGGGGSPSSIQPPQLRSLLDADGGRELMINGGEHRLSLNSNGNSNSGRWPSPDKRNASPFVDEQGFLDLGAASTSLVGLEVQGKWPKRPDPTGSDPRVKDLESKLEELKRIGDRIKEEAASTVEPRVAIPTGLDLDLWLRNSRFGDNDNGNDNGHDTSGSMFPCPSSSSRHQQLQQAFRTSGEALGDGDVPPPPPAAAAAAAGSAFTSPESSPAIRAAEDSLSSGAAVAAPARPKDHPGTEPALSRLLVPPFDNDALRGDFIASLERHLAEYEDGGGGDEVRGVGLGNGKGCAGSGGGGGGSVRNGGGRARRGRDRGTVSVEACDGGRGETAAARSSGRANDDGAGSSLMAAKTTTVSGSRASPGVASAGASRAVEVPRKVNEAERAAPKSGGPAVAVSRNKAPGWKTEQEKDVVFGEKLDGSGGGTKKSSNWAQEYHDYLCSKES